jgi:hypothetical protein
MRKRTLVSGSLLLGAALLAAPAARALTYRSGDLLFVAYQPQGREFIADLGPLQTYLRAGGPVPIAQVSAEDLREAFGRLPQEIRIALVAADGPDGYIASVGQDGFGSSGTASIGSAMGASSQIRALGGNVEGLSRSLAGNDNAGLFEFGETGSYQTTLDATDAGSLGANVPWSVETMWNGGPLTLPVVQARFNPYTGALGAPSEVGRLQVASDGSLTWLPSRGGAGSMADTGRTRRTQ